MKVKTATAPTLSLSTHFASLSDPRVERTKVHQLMDMITIALCAVICGADSWVEIEEFGHAKHAWFATFLDLSQGIPSHDTFGRVFARLDPEQFRHCFLTWVQAIQAVLPADLALDQPNVVALDGKMLRRSHDRTNGKAAIHMVSAWSSAQRLVLAQTKVTEKSNEITALPLLLEQLALEGCIVTIDAMGCQTAIAQTIIDREGDYVLALKENQPTLYTDVQTMFTEGRASAFAEIRHDYQATTEKNHGRIEIRRHWVISDPDYIAYLDPKGVWPHLKSHRSRDGGSQTAGGDEAQHRVSLLHFESRYERSGLWARRS